MADGGERPTLGGTGWHIDHQTLLPILTDERGFRAANSDDRALDGIVDLWSGRPNVALTRFEALVEQQPESWRFRALRADAWRDLGRLDEAMSAYRRLLDEHAGTSAEAVLWQHFGKVHFVAADFGAALDCFQQALDLRLVNGDEELIASSRHAIARAEEEASA